MSDDAGGRKGRLESENNVEKHSSRRRRSPSDPSVREQRNGSNRRARKDGGGFESFTNRLQREDDMEHMKVAGSGVQPESVSEVPSDFLEEGATSVYPDGAKEIPEEEEEVLPSGEGEEFSKRIYVLGMGSLGNFIAHSIRSTVNSAPITLLLRRNQDASSWMEASNCITIESGEHIDRQWGFETEVQKKMDLGEGRELDAGFLERRSRDPPINNLIVCVKAQATVSSLRNIAHRLRPTSTICFLQNGIGQIDEVVRELFPDPEKRPTLVGGIVSHGLTPYKKFHSIHRGQGSVLLSILDYYKPYGTEKKEDGEEDPSGTISANEQNWIQSRSSAWSFSSRYLLQTLTRARALNAVGVKSYEFMLLQLEKIAANCVINPLTSIYDCKNGELLSNEHMMATMRLLIAEISLVIRNLPELKRQFPAGPDHLPASGNPGTRGERYNTGNIHHTYAYRFSPETLENAVMNVARQTQDNQSSMLWDVKLGRNTEIEYLNGYIVKRGEEIGVKCVMNYMIWRMVDARRQLEWRRARQLQYEETWSGLSDEVKRRLEGGKV